MENQNGWATIAAMLGTTPEILRTIAKPWTTNPAAPAIGGKDVENEIIRLTRIAKQLNNTNITEQCIQDALDPADLPLTMSPYGVPQFAISICI